MRSLEDGSVSDGSDDDDANAGEIHSGGKTKASSKSGPGASDNFCSRKKSSSSSSTTSSHSSVPKSDTDDATKGNLVINGMMMR